MPFLDYWGPEKDPSAFEAREIESIKRHILRGDSLRDAYELVNSQLNVIHLRATAIITICGVVVTVTGFSGRLIAGTNTLAQWLVILGLMFCVAAAAVTVLFVQPVRWVTSYMHLDADEWLLTAIRRRNRKTRAFRRATVLLVVGLGFYGASMALALLNPEAGAVSSARDRSTTGVQARQPER